MAFLAALKFLTILPIPWRREATLPELGRSQVYFPVVGLIIGLCLAGLNWGLNLILPSPIVNILLVIFLTLISGGLHIDGFIDTCDGIGGQKSIEARWQAMHDSRAGGFGIAGACLVLLAKFVSLNSVPPSLTMVTLLLALVISRWAMVYAIFAYPYARPSGLGKAFKQEASWWRFGLATIMTLAIAMGSIPLLNTTYSYLAGLVIISGVWIMIVIIATYLRPKFAGLTGDTYGAINELSEVLVFILVSLLAHNHWLGVV